MFLRPRTFASTTSLIVLGFTAVQAATTTANAHSQGQCADSVVTSCNAAFPNNYPGRIACVNTGLDACQGHSHGGGGGGKKSASDNLTSGGGGEGARSSRFKLR